MTAQLQLATADVLADYLVGTVDTGVLESWAEEEFGLAGSAPPNVQPYPAFLVYDHANAVFYHRHGWCVYVDLAVAGLCVCHPRQICITALVPSLGGESSSTEQSLQQASAVRLSRQPPQAASLFKRFHKSLAGVLSRLQRRTHLEWWGVAAPTWKVGRLLSTTAG